MTRSAPAVGRFVVSAYGSHTAGGALRAWAGSPGHNAILLDGSFKYAGAGPVKARFHSRRTTMWVMHFGRK